MFPPEPDEEDEVVESCDSCGYRQVLYSNGYCKACYESLLPSESSDDEEEHICQRGNYSLMSSLPRPPPPAELPPVQYALPPNAPSPEPIESHHQLKLSLVHRTGSIIALPNQEESSSSSTAIAPPSAPPPIHHQQPKAGSATGTESGPHAQPQQQRPDDVLPPRPTRPPPRCVLARSVPEATTHQQQPQPRTVTVTNTRLRHDCYERFGTSPHSNDER